MFEQFLTIFGSVVMIAGIVCVIIGHSIDFNNWIKDKVKEVQNDS